MIDTETMLNIAEKLLDSSKIKETCAKSYYLQCRSTFYMSKGEYEKAMGCSKKLLELRTAAFGQKSFASGLAYELLGDIESLFEKNIESLAWYTKAKDIYCNSKVIMWGYKIGIEIQFAKAMNREIPDREGYETVVKSLIKGLKTDGEEIFDSNLLISISDLCLLDDYFLDILKEFKSEVHSSIKSEHMKKYRNVVSDKIIEYCHSNELDDGFDKEIFEIFNIV
jgi:hypothetical protein